MLPVNSGGHTAYQDFLLVNLRKHYPVPDSISPSTWDIIDRFWNLDLSFTDEFMRDKYSCLLYTSTRKQAGHPGGGSFYCLQEVGGLQ